MRESPSDGLPTLCRAPAGHAPCHTHAPCPVFQRWLTPATLGGFAIAGVRWLEPLGNEEHQALMPCEDGTLLPQWSTAPAVPPAVLACLQGWVRTEGRRYD